MSSGYLGVELGTKSHHLKKKKKQTKMFCMGKDPGAGDNKDDEIEFNLGACILCLGLH